MNLSTALKLGRVSNLPTVWSNVLAGATLANAGINPASIFIVLVAMSLVYTAGMFFNDLFDQDFDRENRPDRPIPAAEISPSSVKYWASAMMILALLLLGINMILSATGNWYPILSCVVLCALVLLYDGWHKENPFGPLIMGLCRGMVYVTAALSMLPAFSFQLGVSAVCLTSWVLGLTMVAKRKNILSGFVVLVASVNLILLSSINDMLDLPELIILSVFSITLIYGFVYQCKQTKYWNSVTLLIAGISLLDAMVIVSMTGTFNKLAMIAVGLFFVTLFFQRYIEGS